ncbi:phosphatase PAP2 family protein [Carboxylicivirga marina]|uniref:Phosphatase PAP2 family protein n=1 Tax=Carboxylicivirga marina TaxID=2800988 RepID=A0ABS1HNK4_9BACT|nr:phosphatase PAP2 family protein [Carboxylicivirga marina]MBK3519176.1 phosphatase PAP2 family protein [Carboxylicivirga marina]
MKSRIKQLLLISFISLLILGSTFLLPFGFSAIHEGWSASFWLLVSHSGGTVGVPLITITFCVLISLHYKGWKRKLLTIGLSLVAFSLVLGVMARFNEFFIKEKLKVERPNVKYLHKQKGFDMDAFYAYESKEERRRYLAYFLRSNADEMTFDGEGLHPKVIRHWIHETGYSFPSGHSFNAFLMATLMAYIILFIYSDFRRRRFFVLPFIWATFVALSRVMLGVHSSVDITCGAAMGALIALVLVYARPIDKLMMQKTVEWNQRMR